MNVAREQLELENKELKIKVYDLQEENRLLKDKFKHLNKMDDFSITYLNLETTEQKFYTGQLVPIHIEGRDVVGVVTEIVRLRDMTLGVFIRIP